MSAAAPSPAPLAPLPPAMWTRSRGVLDNPLFRRWIVLSILLHALAILLFGSPVGGSKEGRAMFGKLSVVIKEGWRDTGPDLRMERELAPRPTEPAPRAPQREFRPAPPVPAPILETSKEIAPIQAEPAAPPAPIERPAPVPQMLERLPAAEPKLEMAPAPKVPPPVEAPPEPVAPPAPIVPPAPMERMTAPRVERQLMEAPVAPPTPPALLERMAPAPRIERQLMEAPVAPPTPPAMMERMAPAPRIERHMMDAPTPPPVVAPAPVAPAPTQAAPAPTPAAPTPSPAATRTPDTLPAESPTPAPRATTPSPAPEITRPAPGDSPFKRSQPEQPSTYDPTAPPKVDVDMMRKRAGELGRSGVGNRAALPFPMPAVPEKKNKMEELIDKARKPDCREHYKSLGLAAVVPLIANEFGEGKCKW